MPRLKGDGLGIRWIAISAVVAGCLAAGPASAEEATPASADAPAVTAQAGQQRIEWLPQIPIEKTLLTVWGEGKVIETEYETGTTPGFDLRDRRGKPLADGDYQYRLTVVPALDDASRKALAQMRAPVDADAAGAGYRRQPFILAGAFSIVGGVLVEHELGTRQIPHERPLAPSAKAGGDLSLWGNLTVRGTAALAALDPEDGKRSVHYAALSGPEVGTYFRGTARLSRGEAVVELPAHFAKLTEARGITVQLTPVGAWSRLFVAEKTPARLVVRQAEGDGEAEFDFLVQGVRSGYAGFEVERAADDEWTFPEPR